MAVADDDEEDVAPLIVLMIAAMMNEAEQSYRLSKLGLGSGVKKRGLVDAPKHTPIHLHLSRMQSHSINHDNKSRSRGDEMTKGLEKVKSGTKGDRIHLNLNVSLSCYINAFMW